MRELWLQKESVQHIKNNGKLSANLFPKEDINFERGEVFTVFVNRLQNVDASLLPLSGQWFELRKWRPSALLFENVEVRRVRVWWDGCLRGGGGRGCRCLGLSQRWWWQWPTLGPPRFPELSVQRTGTQASSVHKPSASSWAQCQSHPVSQMRRGRPVCPRAGARSGTWGWSSERAQPEPCALYLGQTEEVRPSFRERRFQRGSHDAYFGELLQPLICNMSAIIWNMNRTQ